MIWSNSALCTAVGVWDRLHNRCAAKLNTAGNWCPQEHPLPSRVFFFPHSACFCFAILDFISAIASGAVWSSHRPWGHDCPLHMALHSYKHGEFSDTLVEKQRNGFLGSDFLDTRWSSVGAHMADHELEEGEACDDPDSGCDPDTAFAYLVVHPFWSSSLLVLVHIHWHPLACSFLCSPLWFCPVRNFFRFRSSNLLFSSICRMRSCLWSWVMYKSFLRAVFQLKN